MATAKTTTLTFRIEPGLKGVAHSRRARTPLHREHGGSADPGLLRAERHHDSGAASAVY